MTAPSLPPFSAELYAHNRRIADRRDVWPPDALASCEWLDTLHPDWWIAWRGESTVKGFEHPAAFVATRRHGSVAVCAATATELLAAMAAAPEDEDRWRWRNRCCTPRPDPYVPPRYRR